jgi:hypothetical protein
MNAEDVKKSIAADIDSAVKLIELLSYTKDFDVIHDDETLHNYALFSSHMRVAASSLILSFNHLRKFTKSVEQEKK